MFRKSVVALAAAFAAVFVLPAGAADAKPPADPTRPVTTVRVGGSPADAAFRATTQQAASSYREAMAACRTRPAGDRKECVREAKATLKSAQNEAKAAHDAARKPSR